MRTKGQITVFGVLVVLSLSLLAHAKSGGSLVIGEDQPPIHFNPVFADDMYTIRASELLFDGLIGYNLTNQPTAPRLARSWTLNGQDLTFKLQRGATWHDGEPFTADDVIFTVKIMRASHPWFRDLVAGAEKGPDTVTLKLRHPPGDNVEVVLDNLTFKILPAHKFRKGTKKIRYDDPFNQKPVGTGPFRFERRMDKEFIFEVHDQHRPKSAKLDRIKIHVFPAKSLQVEALRTGLLGLLINVRPKDLSVLKSNRKSIRVFESTPLNWWYMAYNHKRPHVRNRMFRQAITYALDRDKLRSAHLGEGWTISGPFAKHDLRNPDAISPRRYDVAKAREILEEAGYVYEGKTLTLNGKAVNLKMLAQPPLGSNEKLFTDLVNQFTKIGVGVEVTKPADIAAHRVLIKKKKFDMVLGRLRPTPGEYLRSLFHSKAGGQRFNYKNDKIDKMLDALHEKADPVLRKRLMKALHKELNRELPFTFLWSVKGYSAYRSDRYEGLEDIHPHYYFSRVTSWSSIGGGR